jgi:hypothetical protein
MEFLENLSNDAIAVISMRTDATMESFNQRILYNDFQRLNTFLNSKTNVGDWIFVTIEGPSLLVTLLSCLQTQRVYFPIDDTFEETTETKVGRWKLQNFEATNSDWIHVDTVQIMGETVQLVERPTYNRKEDCHFISSHLAYIMKSSGTTGSARKTIKVPLVTLMTNLQSIQTRLNQSTLIIPNLAPKTFDPSIIEMLLPLVTGGTVVFPTRNSWMRSDIFWKFIQSSRVNTIMITPSLFSTFSTSIQREMLGLSNVIFGGEVFPNIPSRGGKVWNIYGTTECSVWSSLTLYSDTPSIHDTLPPDVFHVMNNELYIERPLHLQCLIDEEDSQLNVPVLRATGDLVDNGCVIGRINDTVKRFGRRIDFSLMLNNLNKWNNWKLPFPVILTKEDLVILVVDESKSRQDVFDQIKRLNVIEWPDEIWTWPSNLPIPLKNGKLDKNCMSLHSLPTWKPSRDPRILMQDMIGTVSEDEYFLNVGGDSFSAWRLVSILAPNRRNELLQVLLTQQIRSFFAGVSSEILREPKTFSKLVEEWCVRLDMCIDARPLLVDSHIYIGTHSGMFYCINTLQPQIYWSVQTSDRIEVAAVGFDGVLCVVCRNGHAYLISALIKGGQVLGIVHVGGARAAPIVYRGEFLIASYDGCIHRLAPTGELDKISISDKSLSTLEVWQDLIVVTTRSGQVFVLKDFKLLTQVNVSKPIFSKPLLIGGNLYILDVSGLVTIYSLTNELIVKTLQCDGFFADPIIWTNYLAMPSNTGKLNLLSLDTHAVIERQLGNDSLCTPISRNDELLICSTSGFLYKLDQHFQVSVYELSLQAATDEQGGPVSTKMFSSPILNQNGTAVIFGARDEILHCVKV